MYAPRPPLPGPKARPRPRADAPRAHTAHTDTPPRADLTRAAVALLALLSFPLACAGTTHVTEALGAWREGRRTPAIAAARDEVERFRLGNHIARADLEASLAEVDRRLAEQSPILLPDPAPAAPDDDPIDHGHDLDRGLRKDLAAPGATRTLRAVRAVERLGLTRFAPDLFILIWRREPWEADGPLLATQPLALRSVTVKAAALRALEAIR